MWKHGRTDSNQSEVVSALEGIGCTVESIASQGNGVPDIIVGFRGVNILIEIKDGKKTPSQRKLTEDQVKWHKQWNGQVCVVNGPVEAIQAVLRIKGINYAEAKKD